MELYDDLGMLESIMKDNSIDSLDLGIDYTDNNDNDDVDGFPTNSESPFDEHFKLMIKNPSELDDDTLAGIGELIDGKYSDNFHDIKKIVSQPNTVEQLKNSDMIEYITYDDIPVGVLTVINPLMPNYKDVVPGEIYSLYTAYNLDNRLEIEYLTVSDEYAEYPIAQELVNQLAVKEIAAYMVCPVDDKNTNMLLNKVGMEFVKSFKPDFAPAPINLYVTKSPDEQSDDEKSE